MSPLAPAFLEKIELVSRLRTALAGRGYQEVLTDSLGASAGTDPEIEPMAAEYRPLMEPDPPARTLYLHTSPEFAMKRLLMRGSGPIYQIARVYRQGEKGPLHRPEFDMAEYYRPGFTWTELMEEVEAVIREAAKGPVIVRGKRIGLEPPLPRVSVLGAMEDAGIDTAGWAELSDGDYREAFHHAWASGLDDWLAGQGALFLVDFPAQTAVLSRLKDRDPRFSERFELIIGGVEIANGCTELTDPAEHRRRFLLDNEIRIAGGKPALPLPEAFLADLEKFGLPPCAGVALGVDRLAMLAAGADNIEAANALPWLG